MLMTKCCHFKDFLSFKNVCLVQIGSGVELTVLEGLWECQSETGTDQILADDITNLVQLLGILKQVTVRQSQKLH